MHNLRSSLLPALVGLGLVLSGCGGSPTSRRQISAATMGSGATFEPGTVTVDKDDNVVLTVGNSTARPHGFSIEGYGVRREVEPSGRMELKFKSTKPGTFRIFCQLHETHQVATLVVR